MAIIGEQLLQPEDGWLRLDNNHSNIIYTGTWSAASTGGSVYKSAYNMCNINGNKINFKFQGTGLRILGPAKETYDPNIVILIDGISYTFSQYNISATEINQTLAFEKIDLDDQIHEVEIQVNNGLFVGLDAIDIQGRLLHPYLTEKFTLESMEIGDVISCEFIATDTQNSSGFNNLGKATKDTIDTRYSSANPDGSFYFIKTAKGTLVADRVIQKNVTWNSLNQSKLIEGSLYRMHYNMHKPLNPNNNIVEYIDQKNISFRIASASAYCGCCIAIQKPIRPVGVLEVEYEYYFTANSALGHIISITHDFKTPEAQYSNPSYKLAGAYCNLAGSTWIKVKYTIDFDAKTQSLTGGTSTLYQIAPLIQDYDKVYVVLGRSVYNYPGEIVDSVRNLKITHNGISEDIDFTIPNVIVRSMTGGISYMREDGIPSLSYTTFGAFPPTNEYDTYIKKSNLNGKITPGDNKIWNTDYLFNWCKESPMTGSHSRPGTSTVTATGDHRVHRGYDTALNGDFSINTAGTGPGSALSFIGFRPILEYIDKSNQTNNWY